MEKKEAVGQGRVVHAHIFLQSDCSIESKEFEIEFSAFTGHMTVADFQKAEENICDILHEITLMPEQILNLVLTESGEREDVFWNSYFEVTSYTVSDLR